MSKVRAGAGQQIRNQEGREVQKADVAKTQAEVFKEVKKPGAGQLPISDQGIDTDVAKDFVAAEAGQKTGASAMDVRLDATATQSVSEFADTLPWDAYYACKTIMDDVALNRYYDGAMTMPEFKGYLAQAQAPQSKQALSDLRPAMFDQTYSLMTADEKARVDAGQMNLIEFLGIEDAQYEKYGGEAERTYPPYMDVDTSAPISPGKTDAPKLYKPTDIMTRLGSGKGHNVMFGGQLMDRAVLQTMFNAIQGQGDGRISRADVQKFLPHILDAGKITTPEENAILFGLKYCRFTKAADRALAEGIGNKFPDSAIARYGSLSQPPRFKDVEQYDFMDFSNRTADLYGGKAVMSPEEFERFADGKMSLAEFNDVIKRANQPLPADQLRETVGSWTMNEALNAMTDAEHARFEAGKMCPAEAQNIQYRAWEEDNPSMQGRTPYQADYKPGFKPFVADDVANPKLRSLGQQLAKLNDRLDAGDIDGMLALFDKDIVKEQLDFLTSEGQSLGAAKQQFLLEAMNVRSFVSDLSQIEDISLDTSRVEPFGPGASNVFGLAILKNGDAVPANILLDQDYQLTSAVG